MSNSKPTDSEIVKALNQCTCSETNCYGCPYWDVSNCSDQLCMDTLDLINRLQAENERLKGCVKSEEEVREIAKRTMEPLVKEITKEQIDIAVKLTKAEAYKECIEKVMEIATLIEENAFQGCYVISKGNLDNLSKELVGNKQC